MRSLNWPNLMATTSQLYLVNKTYLEYSSLDTFYPKVYKDATTAMKYWMGMDGRIRHWGVHIQKVKNLAEELLENSRSDYYDQSENNVQDLQVAASTIIELVDEILRCETFEDLIALGDINLSLDGSELDFYDTAYIGLNPKIGIFRWEANYSTDETYAYHADMRDLSLIDVSD
tara:strand:+ start:1880 stop:2401 length:522 start_codon:yes stop_codon:yes gene_type:complete